MTLLLTFTGFVVAGLTLLWALARVRATMPMISLGDPIHDREAARDDEVMADYEEAVAKALDGQSPAALVRRRQGRVSRALAVAFVAAGWLMAMAYRLFQGL